MKTNKLFILTVSLFFILTTSCNSNYYEPEVMYEKWIKQNTTYFTNMKDSVGYVLYDIPASRGGKSFYYKITTPGNLDSGSPLSTDSVKVNYRGRIITGTIFDQSYKGNDPMLDSSAKPVTFVANQLIYGWTENLMQMKVGEKRTIVLPQELAYGILGVSVIPPYSTLVFDIQLISFVSTSNKDSI